MKLFTSKEEISAFKCYNCGALRTDLEWKKSGKAACICGSNKVIPIYPNIVGRMRIKIRFVISGY